VIFFASNNDFNYNKYVLDMIYDNALDGPLLHGYPPSLTIVTNAWENKNGKLDGPNHTLMHSRESYTIPEFS
jgi:hypothetical protein